MEEKNLLSLNESKNEKKSKPLGFLNALFYGSIAMSGSLALFLVFYALLRIDSDLGSLISNTKSSPLYLWLYFLLTIGAILLFGVNIALFVYRQRKFNRPKMKRETGSVLGVILGGLASACPICGSSLLLALGITGGLSVFPFKGLEIKAISFALMFLPFWLSLKELKRMKSKIKETGEENVQIEIKEPLENCPLPHDPSFKKKDLFGLISFLAISLIFTLWSYNFLRSDSFFNKNAAKRGHLKAGVLEAAQNLYDEAEAKVLPNQGFQSKIVLKDSIVLLVEKGVIDQEKFSALYEKREGLTDELKNVLSERQDKPILLTRENAQVYVNLLWPLGLSNFMEGNKESPVLGDSLFDFASTGGWDLGREENGGAYFNKFKIVTLTVEQEALVLKIAKNTYRPCCNNSTFFQDCNHGSALLGLLELGASQGLTEEELYREALAFNSFWFGAKYVQMALYFMATKNIDWENVDAKVALSKDYSSASGFYANVARELKKLNLLPGSKGGAGCGT